MTSSLIPRTLLLVILPCAMATSANAGGCPAPGQVDLADWTLDYAITASNGLEVTNLRHGGREVASSIKLTQWNADQGTNGFILRTGCSPTDGFPIYPFADPQVVPVPGGFHLVQDFRMSNWGATCNYRFEQRLELYGDGRFRVASAAYGRGCDTNTWYKPLVRIDIAVGGEGNDRVDYWNGSGWQEIANEDYRVPYVDTHHGPHQTNSGNFAWRVIDTVSGHGYEMEPGNGQYPGEGPGDDAIFFALRHDPAEGDGDLVALGSCCLDDHQVGPHEFLDNESISGQNIVLWYVPRMANDSTAPDYNCWTVVGEPNPETYPCWSGPMFHPLTLFVDGFESGTTSGWSAAVP